MGIFNCENARKKNNQNNQNNPKNKQNNPFCLPFIGFFTQSLQYQL